MSDLKENDDGKNFLKIERIRVCIPFAKESG